MKRIKLGTIGLFSTRWVSLSPESKENIYIAHLFKRVQFENIMRRTNLIQRYNLGLC